MFEGHCREVVADEPYPDAEFVLVDEFDCDAPVMKPKPSIACRGFCPAHEVTQDVSAEVVARKRGELVPIIDRLVHFCDEVAVVFVNALLHNYRAAVLARGAIVFKYLCHLRRRVRSTCGVD